MQEVCLSTLKRIDRKYIRRIFPEIAQIKDQRLQKKVVDVWLLAVKQGRWKRIDHIPFTLLLSTRKTLIQHTRAVTCMAMAVAAQRRDVDMDIVIAGGICHDVGKLLEYEQRGRSIKKSSYGKRVRHPVSGYGLALLARLPDAVAHIISAHSKEGDHVIRTKEAILINHCY
jgi:putative nucleotidyltransferase with HDIG domain